MPPASLAGTVEDSKTQRHERLKSRFRDRGGIFVPPEGNDLVGILLARGVNGESPFKKRAPRKKKSLATSTPRPSTPAAKATKTKTPRTRAPRPAPRKSAAVPSEGDENRPHPTKKRRGTSKASKSQKGKRTEDIAAGSSAGPSRPRDAATRMPLADQLADAINSCKTQAAPVSTPMKSKRALGKCRATGAAASLQPYSDKPQPLDDLEHVSKPINTIKTPLVPMPQEQQRERQGTQRKAGEATSLKSGHANANNAAVKSTKSLAPHELDGSDADDSDVPLAKKHARRLRTLSGPPKKKRRRADPVPNGGKKENKEMSRSAREAASVRIDKVR
ncbi:hypothetical protein BC826DRAFT_1041928 [Russula brevipes]|nr:hypothetical protein BC826DRAFT_1041928 [Russula brevipes]